MDVAITPPRTGRPTAHVLQLHSFKFSQHSFFLNDYLYTQTRFATMACMMLTRQIACALADAMIVDDFTAVNAEHHIPFDRTICINPNSSDHNYNDWATVSDVNISTAATSGLM
jgi:hypothetical protein